MEIFRMGHNIHIRVWGRIRALEGEREKKLELELVLNVRRFLLEAEFLWRWGSPTLCIGVILKPDVTPLFK